nr:hypothetical protein [Tanacetum cinerariifolium]
MIVEETLNIRFLENTPNVKGNGPGWLFDIDSLTISMNYVPVVAGFQTNGIAGTKYNIVAGQAKKKKEPKQEYILITIYTTDPLISQYPKDSAVDARKKATKIDEIPIMTPINDTGIFGNAYDVEAVEEEVDINNVVSSYIIPDAPPTKFLKDYPKDQFKSLGGQITKTFKNVCLHVTYLKWNKKPVQALKDPSYVEAIQDELLQFKLLNVSTLDDLPKDKWAIGTKWVFRNKKDERGIMIKNKEILVTQGHTQKEVIDYDEVFSLVARIEAIRLFLAYASFKDFVVYQIDVKSVFLYKKIEEEVYVCQPSGFEDPYFPNKVYKVEKALYGLHQPLRAWYETLSTYLMDNGFYRGQIDKTFFIKRHKDDILLVQVYVDDIIFGSTRKEMNTEFKSLMHDKFQMSSMGELSFFLTASTPMEPNKAFFKDADAKDVDVHLYRPTIRSLMYLTVSRPDITFVVCACARDSPFDLESFSNSDYAGASLDSKSIIGGCQFLDKRLISYTLTMNPTVYASCVKQFWTTVKVKKVNGQEKIQALVDKQKVIITKDSIRRDLKSDDAEVFPNKQVKGMAKNKEIYVISSHTKKIFANVRRQGHGFSRNVTPLFETMMVNAQEKVGEGLAEVHLPSSEITVKESIPTPSNDPLPSGEDSTQLNKLVILFTNLQQQGRMHDANMFGVDDLEGNEVIVDVREKIIEKEDSIDDPVTIVDEAVTAANVEDSAAPTTTTTADVDDKLTMEKTLIQSKQPSQRLFQLISQYQELKKDQTKLDEGVARELEAKIRAKMKEEERIAMEKDNANKADLSKRVLKEKRIAREKDDANKAVIEEWDDVQTIIDADRQLAEQIQA